jgi:hypothetical protein
MEDLKPCPFCGENPTVDHFPYDQYEHQSGRYAVRCRPCGISFLGDTTDWDFEQNERVDLTAKTIEKINTRWNTRK